MDENYEKKTSWKKQMVKLNEKKWRYFLKIKKNIFWRNKKLVLFKL